MRAFMRKTSSRQRNVCSTSAFSRLYIDIHGQGEQQALETKRSLIQHTVYVQYTDTVEQHLRLQPADCMAYQWELLC